MKYGAAVFDLDGTLIDSLEDLADSANEVLTSFGFPTHALAEYRYFVGNGAKKLMERCLPEDKVSDDLVNEALSRYHIAYIERHLLVKTKPYAGILSMLKTLQEKHIPLGICTNKPHKAALLIVEKLFPAGMFQVVVGDTSTLPRKPDPTKLLNIAKEFGVLPSATAYLGDSGVDMETAVNAGALPIGVTWGFRNREELLEHGAKVLLDKPSDLFSQVDF